MRKLLYTLLITAVFVSCDERLEELNQPRKNATEVPASTLFANGVRETFDMMVNTSVNENVFRLFAQYWAQTTYPDESQYNLTSRTIPAQMWRNSYSYALADLARARELLVAELESGVSAYSDATLNNQIAMVDIMRAYIFHVLVDVFGDVPYTEALDPTNQNPVYDDARTVYNDVIRILTESSNSLSEDGQGFPANQDPVYGGDVENWRLFANSLKLRLGMRLADVDPAASVTIVNEAVAAGVFESNADNASMDYQGNSPNTNPVYEDLVLSGRNDYVAANTIVDVMNSLDDPRRYVYFDENLGADTFEGGEYGTANAYASFTHLGDLLHEPELEGVIMNYAEVEFLLAEAAARGGYNVSGTAASHYHAGIEASFNQWGLSDAAYQAYIAQPEVNYATAPGDWRQKIGLQMWLALYNQGFEAWTTWRRLDFEGLNVPEGLEISDIPLRYTYPLEEAQLNQANYQAAGTAIGGDVVQTPIFWDVNQPLL